MREHTMVGESVRVGDVLGHPQEPEVRWAMVVGIRKGEWKPIHRTIVRMYRKADAERDYPTGRYATTAFLCPWEGRQRSAGWMDD